MESHQKVRHFNVFLDILRKIIFAKQNSNIFYLTVIFISHALIFFIKKSRSEFYKKNPAKHDFLKSS